MDFDDGFISATGNKLVECLEDYVVVVFPLGVLVKITPHDSTDNALDHVGWVVRMWRILLVEVHWGLVGFVTNRGIFDRNSEVKEVD